MGTTFIAVIEDGTVIEKTQIQDLIGYEFATYFFKKEIHASQKSGFAPFPVYHSYKYTPIDIYGNKIEIQVGSLRVVEIGPDEIYYDTFKNRPIIFFDEETKSIKKLISKTKSIDFLFQDLKLNLDILKKVNSWDILLKIKEYDKLKDENERLKAEKIILQERIQELSSSIQ